MTLWEIKKGDTVKLGNQEYFVLEEPHPLLLGVDKHGPGLEAKAQNIATRKVQVLRDYTAVANKLHFVRVTRLEDRDVEDIERIIRKTIQEALEPIFKRLSTAGRLPIRFEGVTNDLIAIVSGELAGEIKPVTAAHTAEAGKF